MRRGMLTGSRPGTLRLTVLLLSAVAGLAAAAWARAAPVAAPAVHAPPPLSAEQAHELGVLALRLKAQPTRCVPFVQTKHLLALPHPLLFSGDFSVGANGAIHWRLVRPLAVEYLFSSGGAWRRAAATAQWESLGLPGGASTATFRVLAALVNLDATALQHFFTVSYTVGSPVRVLAVPKDARLRAVITRAVVDVGARVERVEIREANGDWSEYRFGMAPGAAGTAPAARDPDAAGNADCPSVPTAP